MRRGHVLDFYSNLRNLRLKKLNFFLELQLIVIANVRFWTIREKHFPEF